MKVRFGEVNIPVNIYWKLWRCFCLSSALTLHRWLKIWQDLLKEEEVENSELKKHKKKKKKIKEKRNKKQKVVCHWWFWLILFFLCNTIWLTHFSIFVAEREDLGNATLKRPQKKLKLWCNKNLYIIHQIGSILDSISLF